MLHISESLYSEICKSLERSKKIKTDRKEKVYREEKQKNMS